jgi:hypothetical protein
MSLILIVNIEMRQCYQVFHLHIGGFEMRLIALILLGVVTAISVNATIISVDNNNPSIGQFQSVQAAHNAAVSGDTIYVLIFPTRKCLKN